MTIMNKTLLSLVISSVLSANLFATRMRAPTPTTTRIVALDRIIAVVNREIITEIELQDRVRVVALNLRRQNIELPPMRVLRKQVLERLITEKAIQQRAQETGIRIDDAMVNASIEQIARQNNLTVEELHQRLQQDGVNFNSFREEIRDEITTQRLREREVDAKLVILDSEIDTFLAEKAGFNKVDTMEYHVVHIVLPIEDDIEKVRALATQVEQRARNGENFTKLANEFSRADDALEGGDLGWRDATRLPSDYWYAMKDNLKKNEIYRVEMQNAIHIIKLLDERNGVDAKLTGGPVEQTHARHILMFVSDIASEAEILRRLNDIKARVESGEADFSTMARLNSVDATATRGGDLGWLQPGDTVPEFENAMKALKPGEISEPVKSQFGYHLIQVVDRRVDKDGNPERIRIMARQALREKKLAEAVYNWQRELRDQAYVEIRAEELR